MTDAIFSQTSEAVLKINTWKDIAPEVVAGFTTKQGGFSNLPFFSFNLGLHVEDEIGLVSLNRKKLSNEIGFTTSNWVCSEQIHDNKIVEVTKQHLGKGVFTYEDSIKNTDGLYTKETNVLLTLCFADCVPLYFLAPKRSIIGAAHAGWKGTVKDIAGEMIRTWGCDENVDPRDIFVVIGPSIGKCCYIVDSFVIDAVNKVLNINQITPYALISDGQYSLDLKMLNQLLLVQAGVPHENIQVSSYCTSCENDLFFSHRRDKGRTGRMASFIGLRGGLNS